MRPTDEERREVAARLRELAAENQGLLEPNRMGEVLAEAQKAMGTRGLASVAHVLEHYADLIEPEERTCRNLAGEFNARVGTGMYSFVCSECGYNESTADSMHALCLSLAKPNYCRMCGAKVVER